MRSLEHLIFSLCVNPKKLARFRKSPRKEISRARLTRKEKRALLSRNATRIRAALHMVFWGRGPTA